MNNQDARALERERIVALLARYPELSDEELKEVHRWFHERASALDVGLIASEPGIAANYRAYRKRHYDRFSKEDIIPATIFLLAVSTFVGAIIFMMP